MVVISIVSIASISITISLIKKIMQVVGKIQKEMAEKKLTSDFETVAIIIIIIIIISSSMSKDIIIVIMIFIITIFCCHLC